MATSSPISMVFIVRYCVIKKISEISTTKSGRRISAHVSLASDPIVQNLIVIILSEFAPMEMMKFENALNKAFTTAPESIRLVVVIFLPMEATKTSFTSDKNPEPNSVQVVLRTQEIKKGDSDAVVDLENEDDNMTPIKRIGNIFKKLFDFIRSFVSGK